MAFPLDVGDLFPTMQPNVLSLPATAPFFFENAGELRIIILRGKKGEDKKPHTSQTNPHTHTHSRIARSTMKL
jgi:hypothetical protein